MLYSLIFGESVLNDAVSIVLYKIFSDYADTEIVISFEQHFFAIIGQFFGIFLGSFICGVMIALIASAVLRHLPTILRKVSLSACKVSCKPHKKQTEQKISDRKNIFNSNNTKNISCQRSSSSSTPHHSKQCNYLQIDHQSKDKQSACIAHQTPCIIIDNNKIIDENLLQSEDNKINIDLQSYEECIHKFVQRTEQEKQKQKSEKGISPLTSDVAEKVTTSNTPTSKAFVYHSNKKQQNTDEQNIIHHSNKKNDDFRSNDSEYTSLEFTVIILFAYLSYNLGEVMQLLVIRYLKINISVFFYIYACIHACVYFFVFSDQESYPYFHAVFVCLIMHGII